jgi:hypothetical protein
MSDLTINQDLINPNRLRPGSQEAIDALLLDLQGRARKQLDALHQIWSQDYSFAELRISQLGQELTLIARVAEGRPLEPLNNEDIRNVITRILKYLFVPLYNQNTIYPVYHIPDAFEETGIGQLLSQARVRCLTMADVVTVTRAAKLAQVSRSEIYSWIEAGRLHPVEMEGRQMIELDELRLWTQITEEPGEASS